MYGSIENQELRGLYQFGHPDSTTTRRATDQEPTAAADEHGGSNAEEEGFSPREEHGYGTPSSPAAFGADNDVYVATGDNNNASSYVGGSFEIAVGKEHHKGGSKESVIKKVLGINKKSTKGMTDEEKKAYQLQERWKNALQEEQRLSELEGRIQHEENLTEIVGEIANFPPKVLCLRPLVFHRISAIAPDRQLFVKMAFWDWVAVCIILVANCPITIACNYTQYRKDKDLKVTRDINHGLNLVLACVYLIGIPLAFLIWYWPIYQSNYKLRPTQHVLALSGLIIALAQSVFAFVGPRSYGFCGVLSSEWVGKTREKGVVAPMAIVTALWGLQVIFTCYMICKEFVYYRHDLAVRRAQRRQQALGVQQ